MRDSFHWLLRRSIRSGWRVLDVGCGSGVRVANAGITGDCEVHGVDVHSDSLFAARRNGYATTHHGDILEVISSIPDASFDAVLAVDVIEHLQRSTGLILAREIARVARRRSILMTPNGFLHQPPDIDNPFQEHVSGWSPSDLRILGCQRVFGVYGMKGLRGAYGVPRLRPMAVGTSLSRLSEPFILPLPWFAFAIMGIADKQAVHLG